MLWSTPRRLPRGLPTHAVTDIVASFVACRRADFSYPNDGFVPLAPEHCITHLVRHLDERFAPLLGLFEDVYPRQCRSLAALRTTFELVTSSMLMWGLPLGRRLTEPCGVGLRGDIDLSVNPEDVAAAKASMRATGLRPLAIAEGQLVRIDPDREEAFKAQHLYPRGVAAPMGAPA